MIVGILSDSHGDARTTATAVALLKRLGATALVHCGDIGGDDVLSELIAMPTRFVWGNTDYMTDGMQRYAESVGLTPPTKVPVCWKLGEKRIGIYHGHEPQFERWLARHQNLDNGSEAGDAEIDYLFYGHTHVAADALVAGVRLINPGALHRARVHTVATLDLDTDELAHWVVPHTQEAGASPLRYTL